MGNRWILHSLALLTLPIWFIAFEYWFQPKVISVNVPIVSICVVISFLVHEILHWAAIKIMDSHLSITYGWRRMSPYVRIAGDMKLSTRIVFLLCPVVTISIVCWVVQILAPVAGATCVIVAAANASGSTADLSRVVTLLQRTPSEL